MTDRHAGYTVTLRADIREDDAEPLINAIRMLKGVLDVVPITADTATHCAHIRLSYTLREALYKAIDEALNSTK